MFLLPIGCATYCIIIVEKFEEKYAVLKFNFSFSLFSEFVGVDPDNSFAECVNL